MRGKCFVKMTTAALRCRTGRPVGNRPHNRCREISLMNRDSIGYKIANNCCNQARQITIDWAYWFELEGACWFVQRDINYAHIYNTHPTSGWV